MENDKRKSQAASRQARANPGLSSPNVTAAVGLAETAGLVRARRNSLFTQTIIWVTALICLALLLGSFAQAWSNSQLMRRVQAAQQQTQQLQQQHDLLSQLVNYFKDPFVIESEARQQLGYVRPGEHPVVVVSPTQQGQQATAHQNSSPMLQGFWQEWWKVFFSDSSV